MTDIVIYGRGKTGQSLKKMLGKLGFSCTFYDDEHGFCNDCGEHASDVTIDAKGAECAEEIRTKCFSGQTMVVLCPGVKPNAKGMLCAKQAGSPVLCEFDLCFAHCKSPCVSVTGTNGKTTTCRLIHHILKSVGKKTRLLGNGGVPFSSEALDIGEEEITVLESSSFQLYAAHKFAPHISVVTNIAPDHLDYHENFENYIKAKCNNFLRQTASDFSVFNADDEVACKVAAKSPSQKLFYSVNKTNVDCFYRDGAVHIDCLGAKECFRCDYLSRLQKHNLSNALCAVLVCFVLGVPIAESCSALGSYVFLPHRLQQVAKFNDVVFVDDSKATNVHATVSALSCYENVPLALILGGSDKGCDFDEIFLHTGTNVKLICAVGETADKIVATGQKYSVSVYRCESYMQAARTCYCRIKNIGGVVLMSNACASFDMFDGYASRGEHFVRVVEEICGGKGQN